MSCFNSSSVPVISTLAMEFAVFDHWYAAVPGPTMVNRAYLHGATSHGMGFNNVTAILDGFPQKSIFQSLSEAGITWGLYFEEISDALSFSDVRNTNYWKNYFSIDEFSEQCESGLLPSYSFISPRYFDIPFIPANDQHPSHDVTEGEKLMKSIYESLRASPQWNSSLLIITYDEHGGFYDHMPTPLNVPNPDGIDSTSPVFNFERIGVRIPTVMISPWIDKGSVVHRATGPSPSSEYEHSSIPATLKKLWNLPNFLTNRDAWAGTFESVFSGRTTPRTDCPQTLPNPPMLLRHLKPLTGQEPLSELQLELVQLAASLNGDITGISQLKTEQDGARFIKQQMSKFLRKS